ncbi:ATP-binding cassette domain-containing protein [Clostridium sp. Sa3CUN1]|uniref:ATP-binding cassette domain-containing protein n=1 Tax=Clostridium gallinarum TaxID=2762246 RepID=A0ABR8Q8L1_9CLOT|nr:ATP-binding cassette domain-containing protein [Clostridium gallinarum]MBD7916599.1 ATP-binding cassette domain-containing protein [Clostridium gallinarum]
MEIKVNDIAVDISGRKVFSNVSFEMKKGEMVAITGPSGCGKTTLLNCLGMIKTVDYGKIMINGKNVTKYKDKEKTKFWHDYATFIYQDYGIIEDASVAYNVTLDKYKMNSDKVQKILKKVGLEGRNNELAIVLSGGEKQRIGIARAIFKNATVIYADEPTASLDVKNRELVIELLRQCAKKGAIVVLATHDERLVNECDRIIDMNQF